MSQVSDAFGDYVDPWTEPLPMDINLPHPGAGDLISHLSDASFYIPDYGPPVVEPVPSASGGAQSPFLGNLDLPSPEGPDSGVFDPDIDLASEVIRYLQEEGVAMEPVDEEEFERMIDLLGLMWEDSEIIYEDFPLEEAPVRRSVAIEGIPVVAVGVAEMARGVNCCAVCVEDYAEGERVSRLPCGHCFHKDCISPWFETRVTCPICRFQLV